MRRFLLGLAAVVAVLGALALSPAPARAQFYYHNVYPQYTYPYNQTYPSPYYQTYSYQSTWTYNYPLPYLYYQGYQSGVYPSVSYNFSRAQGPYYSPYLNYSYAPYAYGYRNWWYRY